MIIKSVSNMMVVAAMLATAIQSQVARPMPAENQSSLSPAVPIEPIAAIVEALRAHSVVALGNVEFRGNEQSQAFQVALVRDPRFTAVATDVLVEFGDSRYQNLIDRFVRGEEVPYDSLRRIWQDTTQAEYEWDLPIYEDFFRVVRTTNASLPPNRQLRVLLGDPPVDWDKIHNLDGSS